jgi:LysM repeat protein
MSDDLFPGGPLLRALGIAALVVVAMILASLGGIAAVSSLGASQTKADAPRNLPVYWTVRRGDTYSKIAQRTGLSVADLETFNPRIDPTTIVPGQRLKLREHVPPKKPRPKGPRFWTVRRGHTFSLISAKTGHSVARLRQLNPKLRAATLQPGDRVRLRR